MVSSRIMMLFYQIELEYVIRYGIHLWYSNLTVELKSRLDILRTTMKIMGRIDPLYLQTMLREADKILHGTTHILNCESVMLPSGRRLRIPRCRLNWFKNLFILSTIKVPL